MPAKKSTPPNPLSSDQSSQPEKIKVNIRPSVSVDKQPITVVPDEIKKQSPQAVNISSDKDIPEDIIPKAGELNLGDEEELEEASADSETESTDSVKEKTSDLAEIELKELEHKDNNLGSLVKSANAEMEAEDDSTSPLHGYIYSPPKNQPGSASGVQPESSSARESLQSPKVFDTGTIHPPLSGTKASNSPIKTNQHIPKNRHFKLIVTLIIIGTLLVGVSYFIFSKKLL